MAETTSRISDIEFNASVIIAFVDTPQGRKMVTIKNRYGGSLTPEELTEIAAETFLSE